MKQVRRTVGLVAAICAGLLCASLSFAQSAAVTAEIADRVAPVGSTCMAGDPCASAVIVVASGEPRSGAEVYTASCAMCHASGVAGAPKLGAAADWAPRVAKGLESLYANAISGLNGMPAKGLCSTCSDGELKAAVDHMLENSK